MAVTYDEARETDAPSADADLAVPQLLEPTLDQLIRDEQLRGATPAASLAAVQNLFATKFAYSLNLSDPKDAAKGRNIADFLLRDRKGHCEYFGTGTVLLLRRLGIPARYAVGYSVQDWSDLEGAFVVRNRHAHAWTMAYLDGRWLEVDTTPANWATSEAEEARSVFGPMMDMFSWLWDRLIDYWTEHTLPEIAATIAVVFGAAAALVAGRDPVATPATAECCAQALRQAGARVACARVACREARRATHARRDGARLGAPRQLGRIGAVAAELLDLARRYYRARFDPHAAARRRRSCAPRSAGVRAER
jgi:hypothetical protein